MENKILESVPVNKIEDSPEVNVSKDLRESLSDIGALQPPVLIKQENKFLIISGKKRIQIAKKNGKTSIDAIVIEKEMNEILFQQLLYAANIQVGNQKNVAFKICKNLFNLDQSNEDILRLLPGLKSSRISEWRSIRENHQVLDLVDAGLPLDTAVILSRLTEDLLEHDREKFLDLIHDGKGRFVKRNLIRELSNSPELLEKILLLPKEKTEEFREKMLTVNKIKDLKEQFFEKPCKKVPFTKKILMEIIRKEDCKINLSETEDQGKETNLFVQLKIDSKVYQDLLEYSEPISDFSPLILGYQ